MLNTNEKRKIIDLIKQGMSDYKIGKELKHSPNTIKPIRVELESIDECQIQEEKTEDSFTDEMQKILVNLKNKINRDRLIPELSASGVYFLFLFYFKNAQQPLLELWIQYF